MLAFWPSDAVLIAVQARQVLGPRPALPSPLLRLRTGAWAWVLPVSLGGTIALVAAFPELAHGTTWLSLVAIPLLTVPALAAWLGWRVAAVVTVALFLVGWLAKGHLLGQGTALVLTALSCCTLASYLAAATSHTLLKISVVAMAVLDSILVFGQLLEGPNDAINAASPGGGLELPQLQFGAFGSAVLGYGDLLVAAVLGALLVGRAARWRATVLVLVCSAVFDLLFLVVGTLPATVPVAVVLVGLEIRDRRRRRVDKDAGVGEDADILAG